MAVLRSALSGSVNLFWYAGVRTEGSFIGADVQPCREVAHMLMMSVYKKKRIRGLYIFERKNPVILEGVFFFVGEE